MRRLRQRGGRPAWPARSLRAPWARSNMCVEMVKEHAGRRFQVLAKRRVPRHLRLPCCHSSSLFDPPPRQSSRFRGPGHRTRTRFSKWPLFNSPSLAGIDRPLTPLSTAAVIKPYSSGVAGRIGSTRSTTQDEPQDRAQSPRAANNPKK